MVYKVPVYVYKGPEIMVYVLPFFLGFLFFPTLPGEKKPHTNTKWTGHGYQFCLFLILPEIH